MDRPAAMEGRRMMPRSEWHTKFILIAVVATAAWVLLVRGCERPANGQTYCIQPGACSNVQPWRPSQIAPAPRPKTYAQPTADQGGYDSRGMDATLAGRLKTIEQRIPGGTDQLAREEHIRLVMEHIKAGEEADASRDAAIQSAHDRATSLEQATRENRDDIAAVAGSIANTADAQSLQNIAEWEQRQDEAIAKNIQAIQAIQKQPTPTPAVIAESVARSDSLIAVVRDHAREVVKEAAPVAGSAAVQWALAALGIAGGGGAGGLAGWLALRGVRRLLSRRDDGDDTVATIKEQPQPEERTPSVAATVLPAGVPVSMPQAKHPTRAAADAASPTGTTNLTAIRQARDDAEAALEQCREARLKLEQENERQRQQIAGLEAQLAEAAQARREPDHGTVAEIERLRMDLASARKEIEDRRSTEDHLRQTITETKNRYVRVPEIDAWGEAYKEAIADYAAVNRSKAGICHTIEEMARLIHHSRQVSRRVRGASDEAELVPGTGK